MSEEIKSIEELKKAQAAAQEKGGSVTNYSQWSDILDDFESAGIESTGNFDGDFRLHNQVMEHLENIVHEANEMKQEQDKAPKNDENVKTTAKTKNDSEQLVKANVVNGVSSDIMANYMKYYHLLS